MIFGLHMSVRDLETFIEVDNAYLIKRSIAVVPIISLLHVSCPAVPLSVW